MNPIVDMVDAAEANDETARADDHDLPAHMMEGSDGTIPLRPSSIAKYRTPVDMANARDLTRKIKFKEQVMQNLREYCDREILDLQQEIHVMNQALEARPKTAELQGKNNSPAALARADSLKSSFSASFYSTSSSVNKKHDWVNGKLHKLNLHDACEEAILACRAASIERGEMVQGQEREWWRSRHRVELKCLTAAKFAALIGMFGTGCAICQAELVYMHVDARDASMDAFKMMNSFATFVTILCVYRLYWLRALIFRINRHCRRLTPLNCNISWVDIFSQPSVWLEFAVIGFHCPAFYTAEYDTRTLDNIVVYRAETLAALGNTLRIYLVWRYYRDLVLFHTEKRHTIASFTGAKFGTGYVLKWSMRGWHAVPFMMVVWTIAIVISAYWYRAAELTACSLPTTRMVELCSQAEASEWSLYEEKFIHNNDYYIWDALWLMYITTMTIGYGDIAPTTYYGRVTAAVVGVFGICMAAILTGALITNLEWRPEELATLQILERAKYSDAVKELAVRKLEHRLKNYVRNRRNQKRHNRDNGDVNQPTERDKLPYNTGFAGCVDGITDAVFWMAGVHRRGQMVSSENQELTTQLRRLQQDLSRDVSSCQTEQFKLEHINARSRYMVRALESIHSRLEDPAVMDGLLDHRARQRLSKEKSSRGAQHNMFEAMLKERERHSKSFKKLNEQADLEKDCSSVWEHGKSNSRTRKESHWEKLKRTRKLIASAYDDEFDVTEEQKKQRQDAKLRLLEVIATVDAHRQHRHWLRDKNALIRRIYIVSCVLCVVGILGTCLSMVQNEMVIVGYGSVDQLNALKWTNSVCSLICVVLIFHYYWLHQKLDRVLMHVHSFRKMDLTAARGRGILGMPLFWVEIFLVGCHCPPYLDYQYGSHIMGNFIAYRIETVFSSINLLRLYLAWRIFSNWMLSDLPKRLTLAGFAKINLDSNFIFKRMLKSTASMFYIISIWLVAIFVMGYWYRSAELTACLFPLQSGSVNRHPGCETHEAKYWVILGTEFEKKNDTWLQNASWHMFVTLTTIGYGETLVTTHFGRLTAALCGLVGMLLNMLMIASLSTVLEWNANEKAANKVLARETQKRIRKFNAVKIIELWWQRMLQRNRGFIISDVEREDDRFVPFCVFSARMPVCVFPHGSVPLCSVLLLPRF